MIRIALLLLIGLTAAFSQIPSPPGEPWKAPPEADRLTDPLVGNPKAVARGEKVFTALCWTCHGMTGQGDGPAAEALPIKPARLAGPSVQAQSNGALYWKITHGRGQMPTYEEVISREERWAVVHFLRTLSQP